MAIEGSKQWSPSEPPEFVRFYMGIYNNSLLVLSLFTPPLS